MADLAAAAARELKLGEQAVVTVRRAALLHDVGRAGVPNSAWERSGPLTNADWEQVRLHAYHTERILSRSPALAPLAALAGMHHERQDGSGYHRQVRSMAIPTLARVLAAADVYQALTQDRPHRPAYSSEAAADVLTEEYRGGRLDQQVVGAVLAAAGHRARPPRPTWPSGLSDREVEVLRLVARGRSTREIARELGELDVTLGVAAADPFSARSLDRRRFGPDQCLERGKDQRLFFSPAPNRLLIHAGDFEQQAIGTVPKPLRLHGQIPRAKNPR